MNWAVSSMSDSRMFICLRKTLQPLHAPVPIKMDSIRRRIIRKGAFHHIGYVQLLDLSDYLLDIAHFLIHLSRVLVGLYVVWNCANSEYRGSRKILSSSRIQLIFSCSFTTHHLSRLSPGHDIGPHHQSDRVNLHHV